MASSLSDIRACTLAAFVVLAILQCGLAQPYSATCNIVANSGVAPIQGTITLTQPTDAGAISIQINLSGFNASAPSNHGFHVHAVNDLSSSCTAAGGHYNPTNMTHGAPTDTIRHIGDLGNVASDANGNMSVTITDNIVKLSGPYSVVGKPIVVHSGVDDLGRGNWSDSNTTGHAGTRMGCCLIALNSPPATTVGINTTSGATSAIMRPLGFSGPLAALAAALLLIEAMVGNRQ